MKELSGNPGKRPLNKREPQFRAGRPRCPGHLSPVAKKEWRRISAELRRVDLLASVDAAALAAYCQLYARWADAERGLAESGLLLTTTNGNVVQHPLVGIANTALEGMRKYIVEFGLTPSSRSRLHVAPPAKERTFEEMLSDAVAGLPPVEEHAGSN